MSLDEFLIFVDGELYTGGVVFDSLKGVGWEGGRPAGIWLEANLAKRYQDVSLVSLKYKKLRAYKYDDEGQDLKSQIKSKTTYWNMVETAGDK